MEPHRRPDSSEDQLKPINARRIKCNDDYFHVIDTEEKAYWLGLIGSDGYVSENGKRMELALSGDDEFTLLQQFKKAIGFKGKISKRQPNYPGAKTSYRIAVTSPRMVADLNSHGIVPRKSLIYAFPDLRPDLVRHFVRGYFDGDGSASYKKSGDFLLGVTSSTRFIEELSARLLSVLDLPSHIERYRAPRNPLSASLRIGGNLASFLFLDWIYRDASVFLARKEAKYRLCKETVSKRLSSPENLYNLQSHPKTMSNAKRCAAALGLDLCLDDWNGLSLPMDEQRSIIELYAQGYGVKHIRLMRKCSNTLVRNVLTRNGVQLRGNNEQRIAQRNLSI